MQVGTLIISLFLVKASSSTASGEFSFEIDIESSSEAPVESTQRSNAQELPGNCTHKVLNWQKYSNGFDGRYGNAGKAKTSTAKKTAAFLPSSGAGPPSSGAGRDIGFSVGGAKDTNSFRENIYERKLPLPTDVTHEGLFYDYYFDQQFNESLLGKKQAVAIQEPCTKLFCPSFSVGVSSDPLKRDPTHPDIFLAVGLDSGIKNWSRKGLNLVIVVDISGSMGESFDRYYYDGTKRVDVAKEYPSANFRKSKMEIANEVVASMLRRNLRDDDYVGIALFESSAYTVHEMVSVCDLDVTQLAKKLQTIRQTGGTNFERGYREGLELLKDKKISNNGNHNRIIFLTDAQPNAGDTSKKGLVGMIQTAAQKSIYTTMIGIGLDFNTNLLENFASVKGFNYFSTFSSSQMSKRMDEEFDFFVSPLVFDLELKVESESDMFEIAKVYGSPQADQVTGRVMYINTLFPSAKTDEGVKGGVILIQLKPSKAYLSTTEPQTKDMGKISISTTYKDAEGKVGEDKKVVNIPSATVLKTLAKGYGYFENTGSRKAVFLTRFANTVKSWLRDQRKLKARKRLVDKGRRDEAKKKGFLKFKMVCRPPGPIPVFPIEWSGSQWERKSEKLTVHRNYRRVFSRFLAYANKEVAALGDKTLEQEIFILKGLSAKSPLQYFKNHNFEKPTNSP